MKCIVFVWVLFIYFLQPMGGVFEKSMFYWIFITFSGVVWGPSVPAGCSQNSPRWWAWGESVSCFGQGKISYLLYLRFKWMSLFFLHIGMSHLCKIITWWGYWFKSLDLNQCVCELLTNPRTCNIFCQLSD